MTQQHSGLARAFLPLAVMTAVVALIQSIPGFMAVFNLDSGVTVHGWLAYLNDALFLLTALSAKASARYTGNEGAVGHAFGMFVFAILQTFLGLFDPNWAHILIGIVMLGGSFSLIPAAKKARQAQLTA